MLEKHFDYCRDTCTETVETNKKDTYVNVLMNEGVNLKVVATVKEQTLEVFKKEDSVWISQTQIYQYWKVETTKEKTN